MSKKPHPLNIVHQHRDADFYGMHDRLALTNPQGIQLDLMLMRPGYIPFDAAYNIVAKLSTTGQFLLNPIPQSNIMVATVNAQWYSFNNQIFLDAKFEIVDTQMNSHVSIPAHMWRPPELNS